MNAVGVSQNKDILVTFRNFPLSFGTFRNQQRSVLKPAKKSVEVFRIEIVTTRSHVVAAVLKKQRTLLT